MESNGVDEWTVEGRLVTKCIYMNCRWPRIAVTYTNIKSPATGLVFPDSATSVMYTTIISALSISNHLLAEVRIGWNLQDRRQQPLDLVNEIEKYEVR